MGLTQIQYSNHHLSTKDLNEWILSSAMQKNKSKQSADKKDRDPEV